MSDRASAKGHRHRRTSGRAQGPASTDPYRRPKKLAEPSVCRQCGALFRQGRWTWGEAPEGAAELVCQACHRINDGYPAGKVTLTGLYLGDPQRRSEIINLIRNQELAERAEHPHNRVIAVEESPDGLTVTTTDIHPPRRIAEAVHHAHHGSLDVRFDTGGYFLSAAWRRDL